LYDRYQECFAKHQIQIKNSAQSRSRENLVLIYQAVTGLKHNRTNLDSSEKIMTLDGANMNMQGLAHAYHRPVERRNNLLLRNRFDSALTLLKPLLSNTTSLSGTSLYRAMSQLQKTYPDLNGHEIEALVAAVVRTLQNRSSKGG
jgi:uncharacterized protein with von Willebrand factor type A (vWA) domain